MKLTDDYKFPLLGLSAAAAVLGIGFFVKPVYGANCTTEKCTFYAPPYTFEGLCGTGGSYCECSLQGNHQQQDACGC